MLALEVGSEVVAAVGISLLPIGAVFLGWVVKELRAVSHINATTTQRLAGIEHRVGRIEEVVWRPAWGHRPSTKEEEE